MDLLLSSLFGALIAVAGIFLHNAYQPFGLIISLSALVIGFILVTKMYERRVCNFLFMIFWLAPVTRASTLGNGGELLIQGNFYGNTFIVVGAIVLIALMISARS
mgnify:FL=1